MKMRKTKKMEVFVDVQKEVMVEGTKQTLGHANVVNVCVEECLIRACCNGMIWQEALN